MNIKEESLKSFELLYDLPEPEWPEQSLRDLLSIAFKGRYVDSLGASDQWLQPLSYYGRWRATGWWSGANDTFRDLLYTQYKLAQDRWHRRVECRRVTACAASGGCAGRQRLLSGISLHILYSHFRRRRTRPARLHPVAARI